MLSSRCRTYNHGLFKRAKSPQNMGSLIHSLSSSTLPPNQNGKIYVVARLPITGSKNTEGKPPSCHHLPVSNPIFTPLPSPTEPFQQQAAHMRSTGLLLLRACFLADISPIIAQDTGIGQTLLVTAASAPTSMWGVPPSWRSRPSAPPLRRPCRGKNKSSSALGFANCKEAPPKATDCSNSCCSSR